LVWVDKVVAQRPEGTILVDAGKPAVGAHHGEQGLV
jgi:hypothetical protein